MHPRVQALIQRHYAPQRSEEWFELRRGMLTASDIATVIGQNPFDSPKTLMLQKVLYGVRKPKEGEPKSLLYTMSKKFERSQGSVATFHGEKYEPIARDLYCEKTGEIVHEIGLVQHDTIPWLGGSADGITESGKLIEIKCPLTRKIKQEVPGHYMAQIQLLLEILQLDECDFVQYKPEPLEFCIVNVKKDPTWMDTHYETLKRFWDEVTYKRIHGVCEIV